MAVISQPRTKNSVSLRHQETDVIFVLLNLHIAPSLGNTNKRFTI